jgi:purine-binding chemotaxis protein CheW
MSAPNASQDQPKPREREALERCISVSAAGSLYGLPVSAVQEVIGMRPLTRVFHAPPALAGVTSLRGEVLVVLDLAILLGSHEPTLTTGFEARIVVVREPGGARRRAGVAVDALGGLRELPPEGLAAAPSTSGETARALITGVISSPPPCSVLSVEAILESPMIAPLAAGREVEAV